MLPANYILHNIASSPAFSTGVWTSGPDAGKFYIRYDYISGINLEKSVTRPPTGP